MMDFEEFYRHNITHKLRLIGDDPKEHCKAFYDAMISEIHQLQDTISDLEGEIDELERNEW